MADTVYSMNQYIYGGTSGTCMKQVNHKLLYLDWQIDVDSSPYYRDILLQLRTDDDSAGKSFDNSKSYYLSFGIPRNLNYDLNFSVKLLQDYDGYIYRSTSTKYQFIKYISTRRTSDNGTSNSLVCLYELSEQDEVGAVRSAIRWGAATDVNKVFTTRPYTISEFKQGSLTARYFYEIQDPVNEQNPSYVYYPYVLYHNRNNDKYWMFGGNATKEATWNGSVNDPFGTDNILKGTNDIVLNWIWQQDSTSNMAYYKMVITPQNNSTISLNYVLLQMERISEDADIVTDQIVNTSSYSPDDGRHHPGEGQPVYGRYVDLDQKTGRVNESTGEEEIVADTFKIYELTNLNGTALTTGGIAINRFGIWGHPELMMAINGEEIQIGSSGYYELNDFEVKQLCVVADGVKDMFTLDYQYLA